MEPSRLGLSALAFVLLACSGAPAPPAAGPKDTGVTPTGVWPPPAFADPLRKERLLAALPGLERGFAADIEALGVPGAAVGVVIDGELVFEKGFGFADVEQKTPAGPDSLFRIASLTKAFTAMSVLELRDEGKLSLDDPASRHVPELAALALPTRDAPPITLRHLLSHSAGFPEDNPWGDRQLGLSEDDFSRMLRQGFPFSNAPGTAFEYSNLGFAILGRVVSNVSGMEYADWLRARVLSPLGMTSTVLDERLVPVGRLARGYRREGGAFVAEKNLPHGAFGSMGGLYSSLRDMARFVAFHLSAWPPRDERERGPLRRSSAREMQQIARATGLWASPGLEDEPAFVWSGGYAFGLGTFETCDVSRGVSHTGGLPGYGSILQFFPEHGVGIIALGNLTYAPMYKLARRTLDALRQTGAFAARRPVPAEALLSAKAAAIRLVGAWSDAEASRTFTESFFLDKPKEKLATELSALRAAHGDCHEDGPFDVENALRGGFRMRCERGFIDISLTLAPTAPPKVQFFSAEGAFSPSAALSAASERITALESHWDDAAAAELFDAAVDLGRMKSRLSSLRELRGACRVASPKGGDGARKASFELACERHPVMVQVSLDEKSGKVAEARFSGIPGFAGRCSR